MPHGNRNNASHSPISKTSIGYYWERISQEIGSAYNIELEPIILSFTCTGIFKSVKIMIKRF